ncbi:hypothetical protein [Bartonella fuyuanensis]
MLQIQDSPIAEISRTFRQEHTSVIHNYQFHLFHSFFQKLL